MLILISTTSLSIFVAESSPFHHFMPVEIIGGAKDSPQPHSDLPDPVNTLLVGYLHKTRDGNCYRTLLL